MPRFALALALLLMAACTSDAPDPSAGREPTFTKDGTLTFLRPDSSVITTIDIEIADTDGKRTTGLMRRRSMGYDRGMLFIFDTVEKGNMWMKNTPLPLDIIFVDAQREVINIAERTTPFSLDPIEPDAPRKYVVEVRAGFANRYDLTPNTRIAWQRTADGS
jgi:uncharacterized membrane protein (UPF0127 family)